MPVRDCLKMKKTYAAVALTFILAFAYMQLAILPEARQCIIESQGADASLVKTAASCISAGAVITTALLAVAGAGTLYLGFRRQYFLRIYSYLEKRGKEWFIPVGLTAVAVLFYLTKGNYLAGDALNSTALTMLMADYIKSLTFPYWDFHWYMGSAPFAFYGWLYPLISGALSLATGVEAANKIIFYSLHLLSAGLMYKFAKTATNSSKAAIIAALAYSLSMEHAGRVMIGRSFAVISYALLPLLFLIYESRLSGKIGRNKAIAAMALTAAAMVLNHPADSAFMFMIFATYAALRAIEERAKITGKLVEAAAAFALAFLLTAFWTIPVIAEESEVSQTSKLLEEIVPQAPQPEMLKDALLWPGAWGGKPIFYAGLITVSLGLLGGYYLLRRGKFATAATAISAIALVMIQTTRHSPAMLLMLSLSAGYGFIFISGRLRIDGRKLLLIAIMIIMADTIPGMMQLGYVDFSDFKQFYNRIDAGDGERVLDLATDRRTFWPGMVYVANRQETLFGTLIETAPRGIPYAASVAERASIEYYDEQKNFSDETLDGLYLFGVKYVILHPEQRDRNPSEVFASKETTLGLEKGLQLLKMKEHSTIIASGRTEKADEGTLGKSDAWYLRVPFEERTISFSEMATVIGAMEINRSSATARQILVTQGENENLGTEPKIKVEEVKSRLGKAAIKYSATEKAYLQLSYSHSPYLSVKIDGKETGYWKTAINTIAVKTEKGQHTVTIEGKQSRLRKLLFSVSLAGLFLAVYLIRKNAP